MLVVALDECLLCGLREHLPEVVVVDLSDQFLHKDRVILHLDRRRNRLACLDALDDRQGELGILCYEGLTSLVVPELHLGGYGVPIEMPGVLVLIQARQGATEKL